MAVFSVVVESGSFRAAADRLNLSVSVVSHHVSQLEEVLSVKLIYRSTRHLSLTDQGKRFYSFCKDMVASARAAVDSVRVGVCGKLRVVVPPGYSHSTFIDDIVEFCRQFPDVDLKLEFDYMPRDLIREGIDVAISFGDAGDSSTVVRRLYELEMGVYCAPRVRDALDGGEESGKDPFMARPWLCLESFEQIRFADASGRPCAAMPRSRISVNSLASLIELTVAGLGLACLSVPAVRGAVAAGRLVPALAGVKVDAVVCSVFFPSRPGDSSLSRLFVDFIVERRAGRAEPYLYR